MTQQIINREDVYNLLNSIAKDGTSKRDLSEGSDLIINMTKKLNKYFGEHVRTEYGFQFEIVSYRTKQKEMVNEDVNIDKIKNN
jgi:hypothetical protein